ncbi:unnamed protein product [Euphydryas editha]|uniref:Endonuclease/exonuclease/phosphatase domain-containing protein n=1 Tax=Euphydryas editha TaxID=104508 RepID=A0AAU9UK58_EUPED|nr:unnamed protein product [Euphydryas editha]
MTSKKEPRPQLPGGPIIPSYGSGSGKGRAEGAKNLRVRFRCHPRQHLTLVTHNIHTLRCDKRIVKLEEEINRLQWDILGLSEVRREGEDTITLKSGNLFYYREGDQQSQGGVGFIVRTSLIGYIVAIGSVSNRVAYLILRVCKRYSLKVIQVYAPTSAHPDEEVEAMYKDIIRAIHTNKTYFNVVMGDFNAKISIKDDELRVEQFGYEQRNPRGQRLANFLEKAELFMMNSFQKPPYRKWTWMSPGGSTTNEIDFTMTTRRQIFNDVTVIYMVKTGSDHLLVRGTLNISVKLERSRLMKSTLRPSNAHIQNPENFQLELSNRFDCLDDYVSVDDINSRLVNTVHTVGSQFYRPDRKSGRRKISDQTQSHGRTTLVKPAALW